MTSAFLATRRADFLPETARGRASYDGPIEIGHGQTNSQPRAVEQMLRLLDVCPGDRILVVRRGARTDESRHGPYRFVPLAWETRPSGDRRDGRR